MIQLRGGFTTEDVRLDRLVSFDEKSKNFPITAVLGAPDERPLKTRAHRSKLWLDQGREGACVSFSLHHLVGASPKSSRGLTNDIARLRYYEMQKIDEWEGGAYPGAVPQYDGTSVLAGAKIMQSLGFFESYHWAFNIDEVLLALAYEGPVCFGMPWLDSMWNTRADGLLDTSGKTQGGHAIMGRGLIVPKNGVASVWWPASRITTRIKTSEPLVRVRNSWNTDWGIDGEAVFKASDLQRLVFDSGQGECMVPINRRIVR